ncbi:oxygenase MpaB family protein [Mycolicibacterium sp. CBMA 361]|uniref:oxygenase MpaB family protein n=1 Tax=Mycolicibacterium sp. CBMA 361 TaxID=2606610 RepID=UPI0031BA5419
MSTPVLEGSTVIDGGAYPAGYAGRLDYSDSAHGKVRTLVRRLTGFDLSPSQDIVAGYGHGLWQTDPVAERFVTESMRALFAEFDAVPDWVDPELVEQGAAVWRRWGYDMGSIANAGTMDTYTEGWLAVPLSLAGGYSGQGAMHRHLETSRWWLECARPGATLDRFSQARHITMKIRIMHVSVRRGVSAHPEWDRERWGEPISQSEMLLTLIAGSVAPALGLYAMGYLTSPAETRAVLHFCRYLGYLLGVQCDAIYPRTIAEAVRILYHFDATRGYDGGAASRELVESFVPSFTPAGDKPFLDRLRGRYHLELQAGCTRLFMLPWNRANYTLPAGWAGALFIVLRAPLVATTEAMRRVVPMLDRYWQTSKMRQWERWIEWQSGTHTHQFRDLSSMRR